LSNCKRKVHFALAQGRISRLAQFRALLVATLKPNRTLVV